MIDLLDTENADRNLTSQVTVLTHTPSATSWKLCQALVMLGDGAKNLDGTGGDFEMEIIVGGNTIQPGPQVITAGASDTRMAFQSVPFLVPPGTEVLIKAKSPNAGDTDVDVTAYLVDVAGGVADAILAIAQKLDTAMEQDGAAYRFTANALEQAPTGGGAGEGTIEYTHTLTSSVGGTPIDDALMEVYTESTMQNKVAQGRTNAFGQVTLYLDAGTYYARFSKSGYTFTNPTTITVS